MFFKKYRELKQKNDGVMSFEFLAKNFENFSNDLRDFSTNQTKILKKYHEDLVSLSPYKSLNLLSNNSSLSLNVGININNDSKVLNWK